MQREMPSLSILTPSVLVLSLVAAPAPAQTLTGAVVDAVDGERISNAVVTLRPGPPGPAWVGVRPEWTKQTLTTDERGGYGFTDLVPGPYRLEVSGAGYRTAHLRVLMPPSGESSHVSIGLKPRHATAGASAPQGRVVGWVTDYAAEPVTGASVRVLGSLQASTTSVDGRFSLRLEPGAAALVAEAIGYRPDTVRVDMPFTGSELVTFRLARDPVAVRGLTVAAPRSPSFAMTTTPVTLRQAPALGEPDVFRAVVLLPGVSQPTDLKGRIHLAGGASDETGVNLDGHPLQDPFHLLGLFGAFNVATLARADVLVHHLPPSYGGRLSGVIDLETRAPGSDPEVELGLGLLSSSATVSQSLGSFDILASGRVTYADKLLEAAYDPLALNDLPLFGYEDMVVRVGANLGAWRVETLGFATRDHYELPEDSTAFDPFTWGEGLVGMRAFRQAGAWLLSVRGSFNRAYSHARSPVLDEFVDATRDRTSLGLSAEWLSDPVQLRLGLDADDLRNRQGWSTGASDELFTENTPRVFSGESSLTTAAGWLNAHIAIGRWSWNAGLRGLTVLEGPADDRVWLSPRVAVEYDIADDFGVEVALNRRYQFEAQYEEPVEGSISPPVFLLERPRQADVAAVAAEYHSDAGGGRLRFEAFAKHYPDRPVPTRSAGDGAGQSPFPSFDRVEAQSAGAAVSGVAELGGILIQGSYTFERAREVVNGEWSPTSWNAPHTLVLFGSAPLARRWTVNVAYHGHSGRAVTPVTGMTFVPSSPGEPGSLRRRYIAGIRHSVRVPSYHRADLGIQRRWNGWGADWMASFQVVNVLFRENPIAYDWQDYYARLQMGRDAPAGRRGIPTIPSVHLEVTW